MVRGPVQEVISVDTWLKRAIKSFHCLPRRLQHRLLKLQQGSSFMALTSAGC